MTDSSFLDDCILEAFQKGYREGYLEGQQMGVRETIIRILQKRFPAKTTSKLVSQINSEVDLALLTNWQDLAYMAKNWSEFRTKFKRHQLFLVEHICPELSRFSPIDFSPCVPENSQQPASSAKFAGNHRTPSANQSQARTRRDQRILGRRCNVTDSPSA